MKTISSLYAWTAFTLVSALYRTIRVDTLGLGQFITSPLCWTLSIVSTHRMHQESSGSELAYSLKNVVVRTPASYFGGPGCDPEP
jgi:hypothetical protein